MKFEIKSWITGEVIINIEGDTFALALSAAVKKGADLSSADLSNANLRGADLSSANLRGADLSSADLSSANLSSADLSSADLSSANLSSADLSSANLYNANLRGANLSSANLYNADLYNANLLCIGDMKRIKTLQVDTWNIAYTKTEIQIGCEKHDIAKWFKFTNAEIKQMSSSALTFWKVFKPILKALIKNSPAE